MLQEQLAIDIKNNTLTIIKESLKNSINNNESKNILETLIDSKNTTIDYYAEKLRQENLDDELKTFYQIRVEEERLEQAYYAHYLSENFTLNNVSWWNKQELNNLYSIGYAKNQQEFSDMRTLGFGGSDFRRNVKKINNTNSIIKLIYSKLSTKEVKEFHSGPFYRGHLLEPYIIYKLAENVAPEGKTIILTKDTWKHNDHSSILINVDGLMSSDGGKTIDTLVECKTSTREDYWENGIPLDYQYQMNYYLHALDLKKAVLAVFLNGKFKTFEFNRVDSIEENNFVENIEKLDIIQEKIEHARELIKSHNYTPIQAAEKVVEDNKVSFTKESVKKYQKVLNVDIPGEQFIGFNPFNTNNRFVCLDFETTGCSPEHGGKVIQAAIIIIDNGEIVDKRNDFFTISQLDILNGGLTSDVFHINEEDISRKELFVESELRDVLYDEFVNKKSILVAHNAGFERKFLDSVGIKVDNDTQVLDSRYWLRGFDPTSNNIDSLEVVCARHDIDYSGAHDAMFDTIIMVEAILESAGEPNFFDNTIEK